MKKGMNSEGYPDPTAEGAMERIRKAERRETHGKKHRKPKQPNFYGSKTREKFGTEVWRPSRKS